MAKKLKENSPEFFLERELFKTRTAPSKSGLRRMPEYIASIEAMKKYAAFILEEADEKRRAEIASFASNRNSGFNNVTHRPRREWED